jgi:hypothetical protein
MYVQSEDAFIANKIFPAVSVPNKSDKIWTINKGDFARNSLLVRAPGAESAGIGYNIDADNDYKCEVYSLHNDIPDQIRENADAQLNLEFNATELLTKSVLINREVKFVSTFMSTGVWATEWTGQDTAPSTNQFYYWNDYVNSNPVEDMSNLMKTVHLNSGGFMPNKGAMGYSVFTALKNHPDILDLIKYQGVPANPAQVTVDALAALFGLEELVITYAVYNTANEGATPSYSYISDNNLMLTYTPSAPGLNVPASGYTFNWTGLFGTGTEGFRTKAFRMEWLDSLRIEVDTAYDMQLQDNTMGAFLNGAVGVLA